MSTDRETTRIVRSWLEEGVTALPDPVLDAVLDQLPATHQRRATWWPVRRLPTMNTATKYGMAAAILAVAALLGFNYLIAPNIGDPGLDDVGPTATPSAAASSPDAEALVREWVDAVNRGDGDAMSSLMADRVDNADGVPVDRADAIQAILDTWCPMTIDGVDRSGDSYIVRVTYRDDEAGTCTAGTPGTTGAFVIGVRGGEVTRAP